MYTVYQYYYQQLKPLLTYMYYYYERYVSIQEVWFRTGTFHLKMFLDMLIRNKQGQQNLKYTRNGHDFELQTQGFLHIEPKKN